MEFLVYLVVGVIWLVVNISQQKKAKIKAMEMRRRREEREQEEQRTGKKASPHPLESDLEAFLGRLAGETLQPKPAASPPPPLPNRNPAPNIQFDASPPPAVAPPVSAPPVAKANVSKEPMEMDTAFEDIEELQDAIEISYDNIEEHLQAQTLQTVNQMRIDLSSMRIDTPRLPVQRMRSVHTQTTPPELNTKGAFKKAILSGIILGPPAALQDPSSDAR